MIRAPAPRFLALAALVLAACVGDGPAAPCPAGTSGPGGGECTPCASGTYCPEGSAAPVECVLGTTWDDDADSATECSSVRACSSSEYESAAPTLTVDRQCMAATTCQAGQYVSAEATATEDRECAGCASGSFSVGTNAASCTTWTSCPAGSYVATAGTDTSDRVCGACEPGTYTSGPDQSSCVPVGSCAPGTEQTAPGSSTAPPTCRTCAPGEHCAGGSAQAVPCDDGDGTWDHDGDPSTACVARTTCVAGSQVSVEGDATTDRSCAPCEDSYSTTSNAPSCTPWTTCATGYVEQTPGSSTSDRTCVPGWTLQFGSSAADSGYAIAADASEAVYVAGITSGALPGQTSSGSSDAYVQKVANDGAPLWTHQLGTPAVDFAFALDVDASGHVLVAGITEGALPGETTSGNRDAFVRMLGSDGSVVWTRQFGTSVSDAANAVAVDANGDVLVAGTTDGALPGETTSGSRDAFVRKYGSDGSLLWTRQFGSSAVDEATGVAVDTLGNVFVVGTTEGVLPDATSAGTADAFVCKYAPDGTLLWTRQFGSAGGDWAYGASVDGDGNVAVGGATLGALPGATSAGGFDAFVRVYANDGSEVWTRQVGSSLADIARAVSFDGTGRVLLAGFTHATSFLGISLTGGVNAFVLAFESDGTPGSARVLSTPASDSAYAVCADTEGSVLVAGNTQGVLPGQTASGMQDAFVVKLQLP